MRRPAPGLVARLVGAVGGSSLAGNSAGIMATSVLNAGLGYAYWTLAARLMPAAAVGLGSALVSVMVIVSLLVHLGLGAGLIARLPHRTDRRDWQRTVLAVLLAGTAGTALLAAAALYPLGLAVPGLRAVTHDPASAAAFVLGAAGWSGAGLLDHLFIAERRTGLMVVRNAATAVAKLVVLAALAVARPATGASGLLVSWAVGGLLGAAVGVWACHRRVRPLAWLPPRALGAELGGLGRQVLGHHLISICGLLPTYLLPVVVTARLGAEQNAYFSVTWLVGGAIFMVSPAVASALFAEGSHDRTRLARLSARSLATTVLALIVPVAVVIAGARGILGLFGPGYRAGALLLTVLVLSAFPDAVSNVAVTCLRVRGRLGRAAALNGGIAALALAGGWALTPALGILGAGLAWLAAQLAGAAVVALARRTLVPGPHPDLVADPGGNN